MGAGLVSTSRIDHLWLSYLTYGVGVGIGVACGYAPMVAVVSGWFVRRRNTALGIAVSGIGFGTIVGAPLAAKCIPLYGWRHTYVAVRCVGCFAAFAFRHAREATAHRARQQRTQHWRSAADAGFHAALRVVVSMFGTTLRAVCISTRLRARARGKRGLERRADWRHRDRQRIGTPRPRHAGRPAGTDRPVSTVLPVAGVELRHLAWRTLLPDSGDLRAGDWHRLRRLLGAGAHGAGAVLRHPQPWRTGGLALHQQRVRHAYRTAARRLYHRPHRELSMGDCRRIRDGGDCLSRPAAVTAMRDSRSPPQKMG